MEKGGLVIYEVENDKVKLVLGLGTSDKWDHIVTVELGVQATGCLCTIGLPGQFWSQNPAQWCFCRCSLIRCLPWHMKFWKFWKLGFFFLWYYCICSIFSIYVSISISLSLSSYLSISRCEGPICLLVSLCFQLGWCQKSDGEIYGKRWISNMRLRMIR